MQHQTGLPQNNKVGEAVRELTPESTQQNYMNVSTNYGSNSICTTTVLP